MPGSARLRGVGHQFHSRPLPVMGILILDHHSRVVLSSAVERAFRVVRKRVCYISHLGGQRAGGCHATQDRFSPHPSNPRMGRQPWLHIYATKRLRTHIDPLLLELKQAASGHLSQEDPIALLRVLPGQFELPSMQLLVGFTGVGSLPPPPPSGTCCCACVERVRAA